jgi:hypothetical protein
MKNWPARGTGPAQAKSMQNIPAPTGFIAINSEGRNFFRPASEAGQSATPEMASAIMPGFRQEARLWRRDS